MSEIILIKSLVSYDGLNYFEESYSTGETTYFNAYSEQDKQTIKDLNDDVYPIYALAFVKEEEKPKVEFIYVAQGSKHISPEWISLEIKVKEKIYNRLLIDNFMSCSEIDLTKDFEFNSYISIENSPSLVNQMDFIAFYSNELPITVPESGYKHIDEEDGLCELAQKNEYCMKIYENILSETGRGEFQRDYERIIHSKAFRRMVDKAQIFSTEKGDHYRTRMTHSMVVAQIAKSISKSLKLNNWLTEAIAFGHDIGHTPFGHQGERTLKDILTGEKDVLKSAIAKGAKYGSFKHNYQSLRVATRLEKKYMYYDGLNLSFQTLDGILKHTKINPEEYDIESFVSSRLIREYIDGQVFPYTLEGQVVCIADEIAQRSHDLEDAFSAGRLTIKELKNYLLLSKAEDLKIEIEKIENKFNEVKNKRHIKIDDEVLQELISSKIIHHFIKDVLSQSDSNIKKYLSEDGEQKFNANGHKIDEEIISFSDKGERLCKYLEKIISKKVINSAEVCLFDSNGAKVVESLFSSYYNNPRLLHQGTLQRIMQDFRNETRNVIDFEEGDPRIIEKEWKRIIAIKPEKVDKEPEKKVGEEVPEEVTEELTEEVAEDVVEEFDKDLIEDEYLIKNQILVRNITDFIAGMTDSYALNEYNRIKK